MESLVSGSSTKNYEEPIMLKQRHLLTLAALVGALGLVAGACGSDGEPGLSTGDVATIEDSDGLPLADDTGDTPVVSGMCAPGEPDCEDTLVKDTGVQDLPDPSGRDEHAGDPPVSSGMTIDGGMTVSEAVATGATGVLAVKGQLFDDGTGLQLCEGLVGLGERYGCDGKHIWVINVDLETVGASVVYHDGIVYTEEVVTLLGELVDGSLIVDNLAA